MPLPWLLGALAVAVVGKVVYDAATSSSSTSYSDSEEVRRKAELDRKCRQLTEEIEQNDQRLVSVKQSIVSDAIQSLSPVLSFTQSNSRSGSKSHKSIIDIEFANNKQAQLMRDVCTKAKQTSNLNKFCVDSQMDMKLTTSAKNNLAKLEMWDNYRQQLQAAKKQLEAYTSNKQAQQVLCDSQMDMKLTTSAKNNLAKLEMWDNYRQQQLQAVTLAIRRFFD